MEVPAGRWRCPTHPLPQLWVRVDTRASGYFWFCEVLAVEAASKGDKKMLADLLGALFYLIELTSPSELSL